MTLAAILLGIGLALVLAETLFPSFGVLTIASAACIIAAGVAAFQESTETGVTFLVVTALALPATLGLGFKILPHTPIGKRMTVAGLSFEASHATDNRDLDLAGLEGVVEAELHPAGYARIGGRRVDVVSRGEILPAGTRVRVSEVRGNRVVVARIEDPGGEPNTPATPGQPGEPIEELNS